MGLEAQYEGQGLLTSKGGACHPHGVLATGYVQIVMGHSNRQMPFSKNHPSETAATAEAARIMLS